METLSVPGTDLVCSRIAFGTSSLHHLSAAPRREELLLAALDAGITHFDTSPYYGFGLAEMSLSALAKRGAVTVATKVGLYPPGGADTPQLMLARKVLGKVWPALSKPLADLSVDLARKSLAGSLRRMRRERVDLLLLHEPDLAMLATDEWQRWLESERDKIGAIGVSGEAGHVLPFIRARHPFARIIQTRDSINGNEAAPIRAAGRAPQITFGHLARRDAATPVSKTLTTALARHPDEVLLISTRSVERVRELTRYASSAAQAA